ncbi:MAG: diacylglycerol kinase family lipid kinase [Lachnospiraceae bacterium]|nr:diacylglycerol kinase family lipid kinase [Lachnospiraceae bacterium]
MNQEVLFYINPNSGRQKIKGHVLNMLGEFSRRGYRNVVYVTSPDLAENNRFLRDADGEYEEIVCCGGDGTFSTVLSGIMDWEKKPVLGYIPTGSTNDFASGLGIPQDIEQAVQSILDGTPHVFDAGEIEGRYFSYVASFGAFTETSYSTPQDIKNVMGHSAYLIGALKDFALNDVYHIKAEADGRTYEDDYVFGAVMNAKSVGGVLKFDDAQVDLTDGLLEVMLVKQPRSLADLTAILNAVNFRDFTTPRISFFKTSTLKITSDRDLTWSVDGERLDTGKEPAVKCVHNAFSILLKDL